MAQAFVTQYMDCYRWNNIGDLDQKYESLYDKYFKDPLTGEEWREKATLKNPIKDVPMSELKKEIDKLMKSRYHSCYNHCYCNGAEFKLKGTHIFRKLEEEDSLENVKVTTNDHKNDSELLKQCHKLFDPTETFKKMPPLPTFRILMGYQSPSEFATKLTTYQDEYGRKGYNILMGKYRNKPETKKEQPTKQESKEKTKKPKEKKEKVCLQKRRRHRTYNVLLE